MQEALRHHYPLTTNFVRTVDRVSHKLLLKFTLGETKIRRIIHEDDNDGDKNDKSDEREEKKDTVDTDRLTDVLHDFEEISKTLNDVDIDLTDEFDDSTFIDRAKNFSDDVEELFRGKGMNNLSDISGKNISNIGDIISSAFKGKGSIKKCNENEDKKTNEDTNSTFRDAEEVLNLNDNLTSELINDVSINTTDLNDTDSNLVDTFNNFILDHNYLVENLLETEDTKNVIEDNLLKEIVPVVKGKTRLKDKVKVMKPVKDLSKLKDYNSLATKREKELDNNITADNETDSEASTEPADTKVKAELSKEFLKFGEDFKFRIFELSKEEQLEELQKKREGALYVSAPYKCVGCAKGFRSLETFENHRRVHSPSRGLLSCDICGTRHATPARLRRHAAAHARQYCCLRCAAVARTREQAQAHFLWHAGKRFACPHCGEVFGKVSTQLSHVRLRHGRACATCARCGRGFLGARGLRLHTRRNHQASRSQQSAECYCFTCRVQFWNQDAFRRHEEAASCGTDLRACLECGESFESEELLVEHARGHARAPGEWAACELSISSLDSCAHAPSTRPAPSAPRGARGDNKFVCELCGKKYHSAAALSYHHRSHTGERPFACPLCPKAFAYNHTLQAHVRVHTGERPYRCAQCARAFSNANNLARHKKSVHLGQRQYSRCSVCLKWFSSPSAARLHVASVHHHQPWPRKKHLQPGT